MPGLVIFDMDGLIFDSEYSFMLTLREVMKEYHMDLPRKIYEETLGLSTADTRAIILKHYGPDAPFEEIYRKGRSLLNERTKTHPMAIKQGIPELISLLKEHGIPVCLASSSPRATIDIYLGSAGLADVFPYIISGDDITHSKPHPEIFLLCCERFQVKPKNALVLEDSENGIRAAVAGGIPVICIPDMKRPEENLLSQTAAVCADGLDAARFLGLCD